MNPFHCPRCQSENTSSFPMIYQSGTATGKFSSISYGHNVGAIGTGGRSSSQSLLAQQLTPPKQINNGCSALFLGGILAIVIAGVGFALSITIAIQLDNNGYKGISGGVMLAIIILSFAVAIFALVKVLKRQSAADNLANEEWRKQMQTWQHSWMCLKCGNTWLVND